MERDIKCSYLKIEESSRGRAKCPPKLRTIYFDKNNCEGCSKVRLNDIFSSPSRSKADNDAFAVRRLLKYS